MVQHEVDAGRESCEPLQQLDRLEHERRRGLSVHAVLLGDRRPTYWQAALKHLAIVRRAGRRSRVASKLSLAAGADRGIALGVRVGQLIADAPVDVAPLPSWGPLPDASAD